MEDRRRVLAIRIMKGRSCIIELTNHWKQRPFQQLTIRQLFL